MLEQVLVFCTLIYYVSVLHCSALFLYSNLYCKLAKVFIFSSIVLVMNIISFEMRGWFLTWMTIFLLLCFGLHTWTYQVPVALVDGTIALRQDRLEGEENSLHHYLSNSSRVWFQMYRQIQNVFWREGCACILFHVSNHLKYF